MKKLGFVLVLVAFLVFVDGEANADSVLNSAVACRDEVNSFLRETLKNDLNNLKPVDIRVDVVNENPAGINVSAKTMADAYVVGFAPEVVEKRFAGVPFEVVVKLKCPVKKEQLDDFTTVKLFVAGEVRNFILAEKVTKWFSKFNDAFFSVFDPQWSRLVSTFDRKRGYPKGMWDTFERFHPDVTLTNLTLVVKPYAVLWNGSGGVYDATMKELEDGVTSKAREFICSVDTSSTDVDRALSDCAERLAKMSLDYVKALISPDI